MINTLNLFPFATFSTEKKIANEDANKYKSHSEKGNYLTITFFVTVFCALEIETI